MKSAFYSLSLLICAACSSPQVQPLLPVMQEAILAHNELITSGGMHLPVRTWLPTTPPKAVVIALHGMNDYSNAFAMPGATISAHGIAVYAYDQRGFGASPGTGIWPGEENLVSDLRDMVTVIHQRYPGVPVYVLGESMGGAVAIAAASRPDFPKLDGVILSAPAVWGGNAMNPLYRASLWTLAQLMADKILTGQGLHILASDNIPMLRALGADPLVQKGTRVDSVLGLVRLMDKAYANLRDVHAPLFVLYGKHDQVIPPWAMKPALEGAGPHVFAYYPQGYHMLMRDLHRDIPTGDIIGWILHPNTSVPSGLDNVPVHWEEYHDVTTTDHANVAKPHMSAHISK